MLGRYLYLIVFLVLAFQTTSAKPAQAQPFEIDSIQDWNVIESKFYDVYQDTSGLNFDEVRNMGRFQSNTGKHTVSNTSATYWIRFAINYTGENRNKAYLEFVDSHIGQITGFIPGENGYKTYTMGSSMSFDTKFYDHKNFIFPIVLDPENRQQVLYFKITSDTKTSFRFDIKSDHELISYFKSEYYFLGLFYGILFIMLVTNFGIYIFTREETYLYYSIYVLCAGFLFLNEDGLGHQFIWPDSPEINPLITRFAPLIVLISFSIYSISFLELKKKAAGYARVIFWILGINILLILLKQLPGLSFLTTGWIFILNYLIIYIASIKVYRQHYAPAKYFVIAHSIILIGLTFLLFRKAGISFLTSNITVYSLHAGFAIEITLLSYGLGEKFQFIKKQRMKVKERLVLQLKEKQEAQKRLVEQLRENEKLKDKVNKELENLVELRTTEIKEQKELIARQNDQLIEANSQLLIQAEKISEMNKMLDLDNWHLKKNIRKIEQERVLSKEVNLEEFRRIYPDKLACLKFLADTKWKDGYSCKKCGNEKFCKGKRPFSRRCTKCRYEESPTADTLLHKCKFPLSKAFYALFLIYRNRGKISTQKLSETIDIRQSTCWHFHQKVTTAMQEFEKNHGQPSGWDSILMDSREEEETPKKNRRRSEVSNS